MTITFYKIFLYFFISGLFLLPFFSPAAQKVLRCSICKKVIQNGAKHWKNNMGQVLCSRKCLLESFPMCTVCGRRVRQGKLAWDRSFFVCMECDRKPRCFACQTPCDGVFLSKDRVICRTCKADSVPDQVQAERLFREIRGIVKQQLFIGTENVINFRYLEPAEFFRHSAVLKNVGYQRHGLHVNITKRSRRTGKILKSENNIYILDNMPVRRFHIIAAHELAHEWQQHHYPDVRDPKIREGFAEYVAWSYAKLRKDERERRRIELNPDPVYGDGFRLFRKIHEKGGLPSIRQYLQENQKKGIQP